MLKVLLRVWLGSSVTLVEELRMYPSWVKCISAYFLSSQDELWCCLGRCSQVERFDGRVRTSSSCTPHFHPTISGVPRLSFGSRRLVTSCHWQDSTPLACGCWPICYFVSRIPCASAGSSLGEVCCLCCCSFPSCLATSSGVFPEGPAGGWFCMSGLNGEVNMMDMVWFIWVEMSG